MKRTRTEQRIEEFLEAKELIELAGVQNDPYYQDTLQWMLSPLGKGKFSSKFLKINRNKLLPQILNNHLYGEEIEFPEIEPKEAVSLGTEARTERPCLSTLEAFTKNMLTLGRTGVGKTTFQCFLLDALTKKGVQVFMMDHKNESRRLLKRFQDDLLIIRPDRLWFNPLKPVGSDSRAYFSALAQEFAAIFQLHPGTQFKLTNLLLQLEKGKGDDAPYLSLFDLKLILDSQVAKTKDTALKTISNAIYSLTEMIGEAAYVRDTQHTLLNLPYSVIALECYSLPPRVVRFLSALILIQLQLTLREQGHESSSLERVYFSDESSHEFYPVTQSATGYLPPSRKLFTQIRSGRNGVFAGAQSLGQIDSVVKENVGTFVCLGAQNRDEQREAAQLLGLDLEDAHVLGALEPGEGYFRAPQYKGPVHFKFPLYDFGEYIGDNALNQQMWPHWDLLVKDAIFSPHKESIEAISYTTELGERNEPEEELPSEDTPVVPMQDYITFLQKVVTNQDGERVSVSVFYKSLGWSAGRGNRIKSELLSRRYIQLAKAHAEGKKGGRPRVIFEITDKGEEYLEAFS